MPLTRTPNQTPSWAANANEGTDLFLALIESLPTIGILRFSYICRPSNTVAVGKLLRNFSNLRDVSLR